MRWLSAILVSLLLASASGPASAQMMSNVGTPFSTVRHSFFEQMGLSWGLSRQSPNFNMNLQIGGFQNAQPQFGGFNANAGAQGGVGYRGGPWNLNMNFLAAQGSRASNTMQSPSVTLMNGQQGFVADTSQSPFVISVIPVVGFGGGGPFVDYGAANTPAGRIARGEITLDQLQKKMDEFRRAEEQARRANENPQRAADPVPQPLKTLRIVAKPAHEPAPVPAGGPGGPSSAEQPAPSLEQIRQLQAAHDAKQQQEIADYLQKARDAETSGRPSVARIYYQMAARRATGDAQQEILAALKRVGGE